MENKMTLQQALDKALELLKQKRENARLDLENDVMFHEKELTAQIDAYTDCIETIKNIASKSNYEELEVVKQAITELEEVKKENGELKKKIESIKNDTIDMCEEELMPLFLMFDYEVMKQWTNKLENLKESK